MGYRIMAPPAALEKVVSHFWCMEGQAAVGVSGVAGTAEASGVSGVAGTNGTEGTRSAFTVMPNGQPGLIFQQWPDAFTGFDGGRLPQLFVFGQATAAGQLHATGSYRQIGVSFHPAALRYVFGLSANDLTDRHTAVSEIFASSLSEQLLECRDADEQFSCLARFVLNLTRSNEKYESENTKMAFALTALREGRELSFVRAQLSISERSLERLFLGHIGLTPILYSRINRFQKAMSQLKQGAYSSLTDIAYSLGYFDQSHFIRDFRRFSGVSPRVYLQKSVERMPGFPEWTE